MLSVVCLKHAYILSQIQDRNTIFLPIKNINLNVKSRFIIKIISFDVVPQAQDSR